MFINFLNNLHPNWKFTYEIGPHKLAFLDTQIALSSNNDFSLIMNVYMKPTETTTILNFHAVCPWIWKSALIKCFLNRAFIVCNNWITFHEEMSKLKDIFHMIGYPNEIFDNHVKKFLSEKLMTTNKKCCTIFETFNFQNYFSLKDETPLALQANVYLFEGSCAKNLTYIGQTKTFGNYGYGAPFCLMYINYN